ncbi:TIGR02391 family protein [Cohaesibacter intestini]|uniref:TIGR02391 family protein n=1 Tax=Cohaesibacter intestini TaxID=2211145 RepID=UPI000DE9E5D1|nr:TIGR02391 family protein [Cohaesibacter intestini]
MQDLAAAVPDVELLLEMQPEELGAKLLFLFRQRLEGRERFVRLGNCLSEVTRRDNNNQTPYPAEHTDLIKVAITEAWSWLQAQGMLIPATDGNGENGFCILSRRANSFEDEAEFARHTVSRLLPKEILHPRMADRVWSAFVRGEFDVAVFQATKSIEVFVREAGNHGNELIGMKLMQEAFKPDGGTLTDEDAEAGEREARMQLFRGTIGSYKNPNSHRDVDMNDPMEALEVIFLANHLMKIIEARIAEQEES